MNSDNYNAGFEDARQGRQKQIGPVCDEYNRGWSEGKPWRVASTYVKYISGGELDSLREFREISGLPPRTINDWFANSKYRKRLDCAIAGAVSIKQGRNSVAKRIKEQNPMKTVIVYGPPASGKTLNAEALKNMYGCEGINDGGMMPFSNHRVKRGHLNLMQNPPENTPLGCEVVYIDDALAALKVFKEQGQ